MEIQTDISAYATVLILALGGFAFVGLNLFVGRILRPNLPNEEKNTTYESGEEAEGNTWVRFNVRFYIVALIFLLFDVEIVFLFPWATIFGNKQLIQQTDGLWGWFTLVEMLIFMAILALGLAYAWVKGHLDWVRPTPKPTIFKSPVASDMYQKINEKYK